MHFAFMQLELILCWQFMSTVLTLKVTEPCVAVQVLLIVVDSHKTTVTMLTLVAVLALVHILVIAQSLLRAEDFATELACEHGQPKVVQRLCERRLQTHANS